VDEALIEWLYQVSLGKKACDREMEAAIDAAGGRLPELGAAAAHALVLAAYRTELAEAEGSDDKQLATTLKRRIELVEGEMLAIFETLGDSPT
jgi:hypothetical protein